MSFKDLGLSENILKAIADCGYDTPTPIQSEAIPHVLMMRDVVGLAQTGTGKTASFTLPMIEILAGGRAKARMPRSLILTPTRELAAQIAENFDTYGKYCKLEKALLVGGVSMDEQIKKLDRGVDVLIATPGRLLDLFERGKILLNDIKILVIDEADRMLDMGFIPDIEKIVSFIPPLRQTLLFSATMPPEIKKLTQKFLSNPREVTVAQVSSASERVSQFIVHTTGKKKMEVLEQIIRAEKIQSALVFCNRKRDIAALKRHLQKAGFKTGEMHGDLAQSQRMKTLEEFKNSEITILVCSDVAARGIDINDLSHVFNFDVPRNSEDYVHRIGRTGRAGKEGRAWTLATKADEEYVQDIEKMLKQKIPVADVKGNVKSKAKAKDEKSGSKPEPKSEPKSEQKPKQKSEKSKPEKSKKKAAPKKLEPVRNSEEHYKDRPADEQKKSSDDESSKGRSGVTGFGGDVPDFFG